MVTLPFTGGFLFGVNLGAGGRHDINMSLRVLLLKDVAISA